MITCDICGKKNASSIESVEEYKNAFDEIKGFEFSGAEMSVLKFKGIDHICNDCCMNINIAICDYLISYINNKR